ncbi:larval cuticle protein 65Ag1-like [Culicoides brevitarsis]|uniref:larval cuticle protein 65Ag1-like n=1 Tax=Culicoides brevitarsis TaxID=469753 RepID=UPI00307CAD92
MKIAIVFAAIFAVAIAAGDVEILKYDHDNLGVDNYKFAFETSDGTKHESSGVLNNVGSDAEEIAVRGSYSFVADDGQTYTVNYVADKNGYQPEGAHLPKHE